MNLKITIGLSRLLDYRGHGKLKNVLYLPKKKPVCGYGGSIPNLD